MSNQDEDEVEDELEAMEREAQGMKLPDAPDKSIVVEDALPAAPISEVGGEEERHQRQRERAKARRVALEA
jgi:charged multivesicular body protein 6